MTTHINELYAMSRSDIAAHIDRHWDSRQFITVQQILTAELLRRTSIEVLPMVERDLRLDLYQRSTGLFIVATEQSFWSWPLDLPEPPSDYPLPEERRLNFTEPINKYSYVLARLEAVCVPVP